MTKKITKKTPPRKPKSVKWVKGTNILTGETTKNEVYGRGAKEWATKIRDYYNKLPTNKFGEWQLKTSSDIVKGRRVKTYTVNPKRNTRTYRRSQKMTKKK